MSRTVCYIDGCGVATCINEEDGNCANCTHNNDAHKKFIQENQKNNICGFSMGAHELRECIKSRCKFWIDAEQEKEEIELGIAHSDLYQNEELVRELKETAGGYCVFEVIC